mmetsp:Transcript_20999/g.47810  ORF Transcript_20999/g.47810 Transcript_20999/m.47810 type:complete len:222 (-) Transcript_20999:80-745(-)
MKFSVAKDRLDFTPRADKTGPGSYHPSSQATWEVSPGWKFGGGQRVLSGAPKAPTTPAPDLEQRDNTKYNRAPQYRFGSTKRSLVIPGGHFPPAVDIDAGAKTQGKWRCELPGPGQHNPDDRATSGVVAGPSFSATPRREAYTNIKTHNPGPGAYTAPTVEAPQRCMFGKAARMMVVDTKTTPGPGQYLAATSRTGQAEVGVGGPKWSIPQRKELDLLKHV